LTFFHHPTCPRAGVVQPLILKGYTSSTVTTSPKSHATTAFEMASLPSSAIYCTPPNSSPRQAMLKFEIEQEELVPEALNQRPFLYWVESTKREYRTLPATAGRDLTI
jgi:hypothetical protein